MLTLTPVWGALLIFCLAPLVGALPLTRWVVQVMTGKDLRQVGTGNVGVSAAFYHGGPWAGVPAVFLEAGRGLTVVLLARHYFPMDPVWEVVALMALVMGRYWGAQGAGTTNVAWGFALHDPITAGLIALVSFVSFTVVRERQTGRFLPLVLMPVMTALRYGNGMRVAAVALLAGLLGWIYTRLPDDLDLPMQEVRVESKGVFQFFRGDRGLCRLGDRLNPAQVGQKAAGLSQLKRWGYAVPRGYVLSAGDDPTALVALSQPSVQQPLVVRSSVIGEDGPTASAAGQYWSVLDITSREELQGAIVRCFQSYHQPMAVQYRQDRAGLLLSSQLETGEDSGATMAVIVQEQVRGLYSGVAFSRDPLGRSPDGVAVEALPGAASQVVSGRQTPERYTVIVQAADLPDTIAPEDGGILPDALTLTVIPEGNAAGQVPDRLLQRVAFLARHLEVRHGGIPQDVEWSFDGDTLWVLQSRPITTLYPLWTRKIAAEVIPGVIRPLTWSINRPLTCGVWGQIFTLVLGKRAAGLDFEATASLHYSRAYFNASLLGDIFRRMGLPPESLEFLTRGAKFRKPPLATTLRNGLGLWRLIQREGRLIQDFEDDRRQLFDPLLATLADTPATALSPPALLKRLDEILTALERATYYSILAPLSFAVRQGIGHVPDGALNSDKNPEIAALKGLQQLGEALRPHLPASIIPQLTGDGLRQYLEAHPAIPWQEPWARFLDTYGYLSQGATDVAVPRWQEDPQPLWAQLALWIRQPQPPMASPPKTAYPRVQRRLDLKGTVSDRYSRLLAELRWTLLALETHALQRGWLQREGDLFFLTLAEIRVPWGPPETPPDWAGVIAQRRHQFHQDQALSTVPYLVYGHPPVQPLPPPIPGGTCWQGIGASPGQVEGRIQICSDLSVNPTAPAHWDQATILVVPYTDGGWAPLLAQAGGIIAEVGGRLSHGAIVAREYGIPAVMDIPNATHLFQPGQRVRLDGTHGLVELLPD